MRCVLALCIACVLTATAVAAERAPRPATRQWRKLERAIAHYCRARGSSDDCGEIVGAMRKRPSHLQLRWHHDVLEVIDVAHPRFEDHASVARVRHARHRWIVFAVTGVYAASL